MARPKKKGAAVSFRLTLESHEIMETKAAEKGLTLNVYLASILERAALLERAARESRQPAQ